jgi:hypothetical protein
LHKIRWRYFAYDGPEADPRAVPWREEFHMDTTINTTETNQDLAQTNDPVMDRAMFFMDLEIAELTAVIPQAAAPVAKTVY